MGAGVKSIIVSPDGGEDAVSVQNGEQATWDRILTGGNRTFTVTLTDTRDKTATASVTATGVPTYTKPSISDEDLYRVGEFDSTVEDEAGYYLHASAECNAYPLTGNVDGENTSTVTLTVSRTQTTASEVSWEGDATFSKQFNVQSVSISEGLGSTGFGGIEIEECQESSYNLSLRLVDKYGSEVTKSVNVTPFQSFIEFGANGNSLGIFAPADPDATEKELVVGAKATFNGAVSIGAPATEDGFKCAMEATFTEPVSILRTGTGTSIGVHDTKRPSTEVASALL